MGGKSSSNSISSSMNWESLLDLRSVERCEDPKSGGGGMPVAASLDAPRRADGGH